MTDLHHYEVRLVRAPKDQVWKTVTDLKTPFIEAEDVKVKGTGKGATRTVVTKKGERTEKVAEVQEKKCIVFEVEDGKAEGRIELELEDHELGTMLVHRADLDVKGLFGKGRYKKELKQRLDGIKQTVES